MNRRLFLLGGLAAIASAPRVLHAKVDTSPRYLSLYHTHTGETLDVVYRREGRFETGAQTVLNHFLRDFRTEQVAPMDPGLFDVLFELQQRAGRPDGVFEIISAYRSPQTNAMLRKKSSGVARKSLHLQGKALDVRLRGSATSELRDHAISMRRGGVGYYRRSNFLHLDTGRVRRW
jgi:uncharacterized protein YcbK (DUF882 family)